MTDQRMTALAHANRVRLARATVRRRLETAGSKAKSMRLLARMLTTDPLDEGLASLSVGTVLGWCYRLYRSEIPGLLAKAGVRSESRRVRELTGRQREVLARALEVAAPRDRRAA